jgi:RNA polymerase subunit RPABC4/transcription elongation factor Spt4
MADDPKVYDDGVYEMLWDCKFCGTERLLGKTHKFCPSCGAAQDPEWRYFPSDDEKIAVKDHVYVGADKTCPACNSLVAGNVEFCTRCGAPQTDAARVKTLDTRTRAEGERFEREDRDARQVAAARGLNTKAAPKSSGQPWWVWAIVVLMIAGIGFALYSIFAKRDVVATVEAFEWERTINIEAFSAVPSRSVCTSMPMDAYNVSRSYEQVGSRSVPDGEDCSVQQVDLGDGAFRQQRVCTTRYRQEPVYDYVCSYVVNRWTPSRTAKTTGDKSKAIAWPEPNLACGGTGMALGCERESNRREVYTLKLRTGEDRYECGVPFSMWDAARIEQAFTFQVGVVFNNPDCDTIQPAGGG